MERLYINDDEILIENKIFINIENRKVGLLLNSWGTINDSIFVFTHTEWVGFLFQLPSPDENQVTNEELISGSRENLIGYTSRHLADLQMKWCTNATV
jgi:hypothetical protein